MCPICKKQLTTTKTAFGKRTSCEDCNLVAWGEKPLADKPTREARVRAHNVFDIIWQEEHMTRTEAYEWLRQELKLPTTPHMATMSAAEAGKVAELALKKLNQCRTKRDHHLRERSL